MADLLKKIQHTWSEFDSIEESVTNENVLDVIDQLITTIEQFEFELNPAQSQTILEKMKAKLIRLEAEFDVIFNDQPFIGHGGTPFILDNSKGRQMKRNHDKRDERLQTKKKLIEDQKKKIQNMEWRMIGRNTQTKKSAKFIEKNPIHNGLLELEKLGLIKQWKKNPQYFFVNDLNKVALATFDGKIGIAKRFPAKSQEEWDTVRALVAQANNFEEVMIVG